MYGTRTTKMAIKGRQLAALLHLNTQTRALCFPKVHSYCLTLALEGKSKIM
jgi:hypothetical protein